MFILASASPRRQELLKMIGCNFKVCVSDARELSGDLPPEDMVLRNAEAKAMAVFGNHREIPVLGADTVVALEGRIYGKPKDKEDAIRMLQALSGKSHHVFTGISLINGGKACNAVENTEVFFGKMTESEIEEYVESGEPMDKAGAYAIQGRAAAFIKGIKGSWSNVVGLPLYRLRTLAGEAGVDLYGDNGKGSPAE